MGKNKLKKFARIAEMPHVIEPAFEDLMATGHPLRGKWHESFGNNNPIVLELACGKGEYTIGMARLYPEKNFIGIDIKGARIFQGAQQAEKDGLKNVRFLRTKIDMITAFFATDEVSEIWILFADPQLGKARKRLTHPMFLSRYVQFLVPNGTLHLKTDSTELYEFTKTEGIPEFNDASEKGTFQLVFDTEKLYESGIQKLTPLLQQVLNIRTYYEQIWLNQGKLIKYISYRWEVN